MLLLAILIGLAFVICGSLELVEFFEDHHEDDQTEDDY